MCSVEVEKQEIECMLLLIGNDLPEADTDDTESSIQSLTD